MYVAINPDHVVLRTQTQTTGYSRTTMSSDTGVSIGCCPAVITDRKNWWLKAFCLPRFPATFVSLHICQGRCPIAQCQAGKSAACHFWNDNWSLSQVCSQFVPLSHLLLQKKKKVLKIKPANLKAEACVQQNWPWEGLMVSLRTFIRSCNETMYFKTEILWEILPERMATFHF